MGLVLIKERRILFSEFALSKSQYLYNKVPFLSSFPLYEAVIKFLADKRSVKEAKMNQKSKKQSHYFELGTWLQASVHLSSA